MSLTRGYGKTRPGAPFDTIRLYGKVTWGASGAVTTDAPENNAWSVAKTATGRYTITTTEKYAGLLAASFLTDNQGTETDSAWEIFTPYNTSTGALVLTHAIAGSAADPVSGNTTDIMLEFKVSDL